MYILHLVLKIVDVITCDKFFGNPDVDSMVVVNGGFPLTKPSAVNTADTTVQLVMYRYFHFLDEYNYSIDFN